MPAEPTQSQNNKGGRSAMSTLSDAILIETIKKELRCHRLFEDYMLSPNAVKNMVVTLKPTSALIKENVSLTDLARIQSSNGSTKSSKGDVHRWKTEAQVYGEDSIPLIHHIDPRFYHPKTVTEITKKYGTSLKAKEKETKA